MAGDVSPWYSPSSGAVVTKDGEIITHPETGLPFKKMEDFEAWTRDWQTKNPAKPKIDAVKPVAEPVKPFSMSFDLYAKGSGEMSDERLRELAKAGSDYKYADELVPKVVPKTGPAAAGQPQAPVDPVEKVNADRKAWEGIAINPIREICDLLVQNGIDGTALNRLVAPILQKQSDLVEGHYKAEYQKALRESLSAPIKDDIGKLEKGKIETASAGNVASLAQKYYPEGGKDAFFALINGHYDDKGQFVRGPAAPVIDLLTAIATEGKTFNEEAERTTAYGDSFRKITADPAKARALFDISHFYYLGKQLSAAQNMIFQKGKAAAAKEQERVQKTVKTTPASYLPPSVKDDEEGVPKLLKTVTGYQRSR
jgi:hypothetical protein